MNHETQHARHFKYGFEYFPLERFNFSNPHEAALFKCLSEVIAHGSHIKALGLEKPQSDYPRKMQQFLIKEFNRFFQLTLGIFKTGRVNPEILDYLDRNHSAFPYRAL